MTKLDKLEEMVCKLSDWYTWYKNTKRRYLIIFLLNILFAWLVFGNNNVYLTILGIFYVIKAVVSLLAMFFKYIGEVLEQQENYDSRYGN